MGEGILTLNKDIIVNSKILIYMLLKTPVDTSAQETIAFGQNSRPRATVCGRACLKKTLGKGFFPLNKRVTLAPKLNGLTA